MDALLCSGVGLMGATYPLQVRNNTTSFDDNDFAPPDKPSRSLGRSVNVAVSVPIAGYEIHVRAEYDTAVMHFDGATRYVQMFFYVDVTRVQRRLVVRDERVQANDLLAMEERLKMVGFNGTPSLFVVSDEDRQ